MLNEIDGYPAKQLSGAITGQQESFHPSRRAYPAAASLIPGRRL